MTVFIICCLFLDNHDTNRCVVEILSICWDFLISSSILACLLASIHNDLDAFIDINDDLTTGFLSNWYIFSRNKSYLYLVLFWLIITYLWRWWGLIEHVITFNSSFPMYMMVCMDLNAKDLYDRFLKPNPFPRCDSLKKWLFKEFHLTHLLCCFIVIL